MRRLATAVSCLALVALAACSGPEASAPPEPEESVGATSDSATESSAPDDASTTSAPVDARGEDPGVPELPAEAMEDTEDGAEAFVQYYIDLLNYAGQYPQTGLLETYGDADCGTCDNFELQIQDLKGSTQHFDSNTYEATAVQALRFEDRYRVDVVGRVPGYGVKGHDGPVEQTFPARDPANFLFEVDPTGSSFSVNWIKRVDN